MTGMHWHWQCASPRRAQRLFKKPHIALQKHHQSWPKKYTYSLSIFQSFGNALSILIDIISYLSEFIRFSRISLNS